MSKKTKRVVISAGGTGGHLFPAQALAKQLIDSDIGVEIIFVGSGLTNNRYFHKDKFAFEEVASSTIFRGKILKMSGAFWLILKGIKKSFQILSDFQPDLVVGFGSFHSFPFLAAAVCKKIPIILFESNAIAGKVNRLFSKWAIFSASQFVHQNSGLSGKTVEVDMPLWEGVEKKKISKEQALSYFGLEPDCFTFLVFGGSQGANSINKLFCQVAELLENKKVSFQVIHITGHQNNHEAVQRAYSDLNIKACVKEFETQMNFAWAVADLAICRSGAATMAELVAYEVPPILIPFPKASEDHQRKNAEFIENEVKGGVTLLESELTQDRLLKIIEELLDPSTNKLENMRASIRSFKERAKKENLCSIICKILE